MKTGTKVMITLGRYRGIEGKIVAKNRVRPALTEGKRAVELEYKGEKIVVALPEGILK